MAEKSGMIFGNVLNPGSGKFGRDLVGEWRPPARYVAAAGTPSTSTSTSCASNTSDERPVCAITNTSDAHGSANPSGVHVTGTQ